MLPDHVDRFLRIFDAMFRAREERGGDVKLAPLGDESATCFCRDGACLAVRLDVYSGPSKGPAVGVSNRPTI